MSKMNKIFMERTLHDISTKYEEIIDSIKESMKDIEYEVSDEDIVIYSKSDALQVKSIKVDEQDITICYTLVDDIDPCIEEIDLSMLKFQDQITILEYLVSKIEDIKAPEEFTSEWR